MPQLGENICKTRIWWNTEIQTHERTFKTTKKKQPNLKGKQNIWTPYQATDGKSAYEMLNMRYECTPITVGTNKQNTKRW